MMPEIKCVECKHTFYVSELWIVDKEVHNKNAGKGQVTYCHHCKKETGYELIEKPGDSFMRSCFVGLEKAQRLRMNGE